MVLSRVWSTAWHDYCKPYSTVNLNELGLKLSTVSLSGRVSAYWISFHIRLNLKCVEAKYFTTFGCMEPCTIADT